ncbi:hypothetical protein EVG20_g5062 [Dentipellis fragilis]|uniref:BTB domain-containing protein n=1 Tax=Dentipellis fragilis TaxID=205917 RepID=A0A4Y9YWB6_9AGAM|nr:hypothetical protein EVG20_g5062 [Dentipellis fragilis]
MAQRVQNFLRPFERVKGAVEGLARKHPSQPPETPEVKLDEQTEAVNEETKPVDEYDAVLAVVGHGEKTVGETGCVFVFRNEGSLAAGGSPRLQLERIFPVKHDFSLQVLQVPVDTLDATLCLEVHEGDKKALEFITVDKDSLSALLSAYREFKEAADGDDEKSSSYPWLAPYSSHRATWVSVYPPWDLRHVADPLHGRLSRGCAGMPGNDVADYFAIRDDWFHQRTHTVVTNDTEKVHLRVRVGSFNVNGKLPSQDLSSWVGWTPSSATDKHDEKAEWDKLIPPMKELSPLSLGDVGKSAHEKDKEHAPEQSDTLLTEQTSQDPVDPDLLIFGFQELDLSTEALLYSTKTTREEAWTEAIFAGLGDKRDLYEKLVSKQLVGMLLLVFVKKDLQEHFAEIGTSAGNKGATAIRLTYRPPSSPEIPSPCPTTITIVNAHLAAYDEMYERRNADFHDISRRLAFSPSSAYVTPLAQDGTPVSSMSIYRSDALIWMGDLNYRINISDPDVRSILSSAPLHKASATLLKYDQLKTSMQRKEAFVHYTEDPISFLPTYRCNTGLMTDSMGYDLKRKPAWTDRILRLTSPYLTLQQDSYSSHPEITMSDHKPVSADFSMTFAKADCLVVDAKANALYKSVAEFDPEAIREVPTFEIESPVIELGNVSYEKPIVRELKIKNISKVPSAFRFYPHDLDQPTHPDWLHIEPMTGLLLPSEEITLHFTIFVSRASPSTSRLNTRADSLEYMVILHTVLGKDHFIALAGVYEPTCFANTLSTLTRLPGPIRIIQHPNELLPVTQPINAPKEVMRLVNWLMSDSVGDLDDLFFVPGAEETVEQIRECLDTDSPFPDSASTKSEFAHAIATALLALLDSLVEPVIPYDLHARCASVVSKDDAFEMLDAFPGEAINVWISVTAFLHYLAAQTERKHDEEKASLSPTVTEESVDPPTEDVASSKQITEPSRAAQLGTDCLPLALSTQQVEDQLFKIHKSFLEKHSPYFRKMLSDPQSPYSSGAAGLCDAQPIHIPQVTIFEFETLLNSFYSTTLYDDAGVLSSRDQCLALLRAAHHFDMIANSDKMQERIVATLTSSNCKPPMGDFELLALAEKYDIKIKHLLPVLERVVGRLSYLTADEMQQLAGSGVLLSKICRAREETRCKILPVDQSRSMQQVICRIFGIPYLQLPFKFSNLLPVPSK